MSDAHPLEALIARALADLTAERDSLKAELATTQQALQREQLTCDVMNEIVLAYVAAGKRGFDLLEALKRAVEAAHGIRSKQ